MDVQIVSVLFVNVDFETCVLLVLKIEVEGTTLPAIMRASVYLM